MWGSRNRFEFDGELAVAALFIGMQAQFEWQRSYCSITLRDTVCPVTPLCCIYLLFGWGVVVPVVLRHTWSTVAITVLARKLDWNCEESGPIFLNWFRCVFDVCLCIDTVLCRWRKCRDLEANYFALEKPIKSISKVYSRIFPNPLRGYLLQFSTLIESVLILPFPSNILKHKRFSYLPEIVDLRGQS